MKKVKSVLCLMLAVVMCMCLFAACAPAADDSADAGSDWEYVSNNGKLVIGITEYAPMNYYDEDGNLIGFDTEFAEAACAILGVEPEFVVIEWDSKELELSSKKIDCIWNGLTVTEERKANMDFTTSYLANEQAVVVRAEDAAKYTTVESLADATVVCEEGSAGADAAVDAGCDYTGLTAQSDALLEVSAGTADVAIIDVTMANAMTGEGTSYEGLVIIEGIDMLDEEYAIGFRLGSDITAMLNDAIQQLIDNGTIADLAAKYELSDLVIA